MAYVINEEICINCGICHAECPVDAIDEESNFHVINPDICIDCGACAGVCPEECISSS